VSVVHGPPLQRRLVVLRVGSQNCGERDSQNRGAKHVHKWIRVRAAPFDEEEIPESKLAEHRSPYTRVYVKSTAEIFKTNTEKHLKEIQLELAS